MAARPQHQSAALPCEDVAQQANSGPCRWRGFVRTEVSQPGRPRGDHRPGGAGQGCRPLDPADIDDLILGCGLPAARRGSTWAGSHRSYGLRPLAGNHHHPVWRVVLRGGHAPRRPPKGGGNAWHDPRADGVLPDATWRWAGPRRTSPGCAASAEPGRTSWAPVVEPPAEQAMIGSPMTATTSEGSSVDRRRFGGQVGSWRASPTQRVVVHPEPARDAADSHVDLQV